MAENLIRINEYVNIILGQILIESSNVKAINGTRLGTPKAERHLLVEGSTDESFYKEIVSEDVMVDIADRLLRGNALFTAELSIPANPNNKEAIRSVILAEEKLNPYISWPNGSDNLDVYGIIDRDYDDEMSGDNLQHLIITDVHDLEMTIIQNAGEEIFQYIPECKITDEDVAKAECLAYQLSEIRKAVNKYCKEYSDTADTDVYISHAVLSGKEGFVNYIKYSDEFQINADKTIAYILSNQTKDFSEKMFSVHKKGIKKILSRRINKEGIFKYSYEDFNAKSQDDFWNDVNGHDYLNALTYVNSSAREKYATKSLRGLNRLFEGDLINAYIKNFADRVYNISTCKRLKSLGLAKE